MLLYNVTESVSFLAPKVWDIVPDIIKNLESLNSVKGKIKQGNQITVLAH